MTKTFHVVRRYGEESTTVEANWFRFRWFTNEVVFYRGLRKVGYIDDVSSVTEVRHA